MKSTMRVTAAFLIAGAVALSSCGGVDRAGTKKNLLKSMATTGASAEDQKCVANLIDKYSDSDLKSMDAALNKDGLSSTNPLAVKFLGQTKECLVGTLRTQFVDQFSAAIPTITADQKTCVTKLVNAKSAAELEAADESFGVEIAKSCLGLTS
jgi:hypothetical protein